MGVAGGILLGNMIAGLFGRGLASSKNELWPSPSLAMLEQGFPLVSFLLLLLFQPPAIAGGSIQSVAIT
jgi:hypothetical protein